MPLDFLGFINDGVPASWSNEKRLRLLNSFVYGTGYVDMIQDVDGALIPNPVSKNEYGNATIQAFIIEAIETYEVNQDADIARLAAIDDVNTEFGDWDT